MAVLSVRIVGQTDRWHKQTDGTNTIAATSPTSTASVAAETNGAAEANGAAASDISHT